MNMDSKKTNGLRDKLKETTRKAILEAAADILMSDSINFRMEEVAKLAGVAIGTLYNYFSDRQALINTIIEDRRMVADVHISQILEKTSGLHISARLNAFFSDLFNFLERHSILARHYLHIHHTVQQKEIVVNSSDQKTMMYILEEYIAEMLQTAMERKEISQEYMDTLSLLISCFVRGIFAKSAEGQQIKVKSATSKFLTRLFLTGSEGMD
jgi:AcrR family transcriptional regulator